MIGFIYFKSLLCKSKSGWSFLLCKSHSNSVPIILHEQDYEYTNRSKEHKKYSLKKIGYIHTRSNCIWLWENEVNSNHNDKHKSGPHQVKTETSFHPPSVLLRVSVEPHGKPDGLWKRNDNVEKHAKPNWRCVHVSIVTSILVFIGFLSLSSLMDCNECLVIYNKSEEVCPRSNSVDDETTFERNYHAASVCSFATGQTWFRQTFLKLIKCVCIILNFLSWSGGVKRSLLFVFKILFLHFWF